MGDSITKGYRPYVDELLHNQSYVDMLATSKAMDNPSLLKEIDYMIQHREDFHYDVIHMNNGLHGWHLSPSQYEDQYNKLIRHVLQIAQSATIIIANSTPMTEVGNRAVINPQLNGQVEDRNRAVNRIVEQYNLAINDLYKPKYGRSEYRVADGYHYNEKGKKAQAEIVAKAIRDCL
ncbi:SGNH/GDSL hydrolase family protein [Paenibacillus roseipurpureus]|uniref:SGNH/GDSL hydrolase family protein n=1 Tax=Paenibacillus roseopurpureus TaxID=2918901 RepID=A0AA96LVY6_9BACL|nr:SGNH/GDSL hydrolase family protein [Paenibacillus sp. MBLB1832]WNR47094.1 SGNH/GDSL hydrolase family protein [Paenibacillus sp. MBLB1832]